MLAFCSGFSLSQRGRRTPPSLKIVSASSSDFVVCAGGPIEEIFVQTTSALK